MAVASCSWPFEKQGAAVDRQLLVTATKAQELGQVAVIDSLRQAGRVLDQLWIAADPESDDALRLAEASQCVHRALITLATP